MKPSRVLASLIITGILPFSAVFAAQGPATNLELFYQALGSGRLNEAKKYVNPQDRTSLALAGLFSRLYQNPGGDEPALNEESKRNTVLKTTVLSLVNAQGLPVYWYEDAVWAKVLLNPGFGEGFVFLLQKAQDAWYISLDSEALNFMLQLLDSGQDPLSLKTNGRRSPGYQAQAFLQALLQGDFAKSRMFVAKEGKDFFSLLSLLSLGIDSKPEQALKVVKEQIDGAQASVEIELNKDKHLLLELILQNGEWLISFNSGH